MFATPKHLLQKSARAAVRPFGFDLRRIPHGDYQSETSKCRARLARYCVGYGVDLGPGGDPITEEAIRIDLPQPYSRAGVFPVQLGGDATKLHWFRDGVLDYVYSSHLLEDFTDTKSVLAEWLRVLRPGGHLIIFCPDEQAYRAHCDRTGQTYNQHHKLPDFSLNKVKAALGELGNTFIIYECPLIDIYSWELVAMKRSPPTT
jgi:SAM-dependent methyltransferase